MAKKHWIYIKRGLSEDPKHRANMGECIWVFMHIIDRADWETGIAYEWIDAQEAHEMSMPLPTLRYQRRKLEELGYITCQQRQRSQDIVIHEWINPRDYSGGIMNKKEVEETEKESQGDNGLSPSEFQGDNQGYNQGDNHGDNHVTGGINTPTSSSESESISLKDNEDSTVEERTALLANLYEENIGFITPIQADILKDAAADYPMAWYEQAFKIAVSNNARNWQYVGTILGNWKKHGYGWKPNGNGYGGKNGKNRRNSQAPEPDNYVEELDKKRARLRKQMEAGNA